MGENCGRVRTPFTISRYLASGATGLVFEVSDKIVVKTVWRFENNAGKDHQQEADSFEGMKNESGIYDILCRPRNWHQNIVPCFLNTPFIYFSKGRHMTFTIISARKDLFQGQTDVVGCIRYLLLLPGLSSCS